MTALSPLDRPNAYIGRGVPRPNLARLLQGRGQYVSDLVLPRMVHVAFLRSPYAHARILKIDRDAGSRDHPPDRPGRLRRSRCRCLPPDLQRRPEILDVPDDNVLHNHDNPTGEGVAC